MSADDLHISLNDLIVKLMDLKVHAYPKVYHKSKGTLLKDHSKCFATNIREDVLAAWRGTENPVLESHIRHMKVQRAKLNGEN
jgi:hypothetical protein